MRLIDADKLEPIEKYVGFYDPSTQEFVRFVYMEDIEKADTVEAIPIKWIEQWERDYIYADPIDRMLGAHTAVVYMLKDWEKENGTDK